MSISQTPRHPTAVTGTVVSINIVLQSIQVLIVLSYHVGLQVVQQVDLYCGANHYLHHLCQVLAAQALYLHLQTHLQTELKDDIMISQNYKDCSNLAT